MAIKFAYLCTKIGNMDKLIGRDKECAELERCLNSDRSELVIVYGRRRIGKTFLIEEFFNQEFDFKYVGAHGMTTRRQLNNFQSVLNSYSKKKVSHLRNWNLTSCITHSLTMRNYTLQSSSYSVSMNPG